MADHHFSLRVIWSDADLLDVETSVCFGNWSGTDTAYAGRDDLTAFADSLDRVAKGSREASLSIGQPNLGYASCRIFEYGGPRRLGMDVVVGAGEPGTGRRPYKGKREWRMSVPIERGQLATFAASIRVAARDELGIAVLPLPPDWP